MTPARAAAPALAALTAGVLVYELALTRILSVALFYPFAFLTLSVAMLGLGLGAVLIATSTALRQRALDATLFAAALAFGIALLGAYPVWNALPVNPMSLALDPWQPLWLGALLSLLTLPFVAAGIFIARLFATEAKAAAHLYMADLLGAAGGVVLYAACVGPLGGVGCLALAAALALLAATLSRPMSLAVRGLLAAGIAAGIAGAPQLEAWLPLRVTSDKLMGSAVARTTPRGQRWSVGSAVDVIPSDEGALLVIDGGTAISVVPRYERGHAPAPPTGLRALPYVLGPGRSTLVIGSGGGVEVLAALGAKSERIVALEIDPVVNALVRGPLTRVVGGLFTHPAVELHTAEARSFLASRSPSERFDAIVAFHTISNAAGGTSALALSESYTLTIEALHLFSERLSDDGVLLISRPEEQLGRLAVTLAQAWPAPDLERHVVVVTQSQARPDFLAALLVRKRPFDAAALAALRRLTPGRIAFAPDGAGDTQAYFHAALTFPAAAPTPPYRAASLVPTTDDRPFFNMLRPWHALRWDDVVQVLGAGKQARARLEDAAVPQVGVLLALAQLSLLGLVLLGLAARRLRRAGVSAESWHTALAAGACGLAFMLLEVALVQMLTRVVGEPGRAMVCVVGGLLLSTGLGSRWWVSKRGWVVGRGAMAAMLAAVAVALVVPIALDAIAPAPAWARAAFAVATVGAAGLWLGTPFPALLGTLARPELVAWAWAVNSVASVLGAVLALIVASSLGLRATALFAAGLYGLLIVLGRRSARLVQPGSQLDHQPDLHHAVGRHFEEVGGGA